MALFLTALVLVALAELADKSQLLALGLATKYRPLTVLAGVFVAGLALNVIAALAGSTFGELIPAGVLAWLVGLLFIAFGVVTLRGTRHNDDEEPASKSNRVRGPFATVVASFFLAEMGDKTQLLVATMSADPTSVSPGTVFGTALGRSARSSGCLSSREPRLLYSVRPSAWSWPMELR